MKNLLPVFLLLGVIQLHAQETMTAQKSKSDKTSVVRTLTATDEENKRKLMVADGKTRALFKMVEDRRLIVPGKSEAVLSAEIVKLAKDEFGMEEHWHKKIVRAGVNTLATYSQNPPDRTIQKDDIVILDFGPNYQGWETDFGRTYVLGNDPLKLKLKKDVDAGWHEAKAWYDKQTHLTGAEFFTYLTELAKRYGWEFGGEIGGHIIGRFPHEQPDLKGDLSLDVHPGNNTSILGLDRHGNKRQWILEIQFVDKTKGIGGFYEEMLN